MEILMHAILMIPVTGFIISLLLPERWEAMISRLAQATVGLHLLGYLVFLVDWLMHEHPVIDIKEFVLYKTAGYEYFIDFHFDAITAVYGIVGSSLTFLVALYSRAYMHRESGFKRFFNTILFFFTGYNLIIFAGNMETLFIGWEILGICSFLLIAFYRDRYLPVRNAVKVYSVYRLGDIGLILVMWMSHHLFHQNVIFNELADAKMVHEHLEAHTGIGVVIALLILLAAVVKSAQLPFSAWLPRAMEGPTPSSAIFYGSLSVHLGVFLLMRTYPYWEEQISVRIVIGAVGAMTSVISLGIARVQSSIKSQIAYASLVQIGLMFIEVALGLEWLALLHFAGNAFLRTYQLLVSPSIVAYRIRDQFYNFQPRPSTMEDGWPKRIQYTLYVLCLKEWNLDTLMHKLYRVPIKRMGRYALPMRGGLLALIFVPVFAGALVLRLLDMELPGWLSALLPPVLAIVAMLMVARAYVERKNPFTAWTLVTAIHFWIALAVSFNEHFSIDHILIYLVGVVLSGLVGLFILLHLRKRAGAIDLNQYHGYSRAYPGLTLLFLGACLGVTGFPVTPTFIGEDLIFSHIHADQIPLAAFTAIALIIDGLAVVRIFAKVFNGTPIHQEQETAYHSS